MKRELLASDKALIEELMASAEYAKEGVKGILPYLPEFPEYLVREFVLFRKDDVICGLKKPITCSNRRAMEILAHWTNLHKKGRPSRGEMIMDQTTQKTPIKNEKVEKRAVSRKTKSNAIDQKKIKELMLEGKNAGEVGKALGIPWQTANMIMKRIRSSENRKKIYYEHVGKVENIPTKVTESPNPEPAKNPDKVLSDLSEELVRLAKEGEPKDQTPINSKPQTSSTQTKDGKELVLPLHQQVSLKEGGIVSGSSEIDKLIDDMDSRNDTPVSRNDVAKERNEEPKTEESYKIGQHDEMEIWKHLFDYLNKAEQIVEKSARQQAPKEEHYSVAILKQLARRINRNEVGIEGVSMDEKNGVLQVKFITPEQAKAGKESA